MWDMIPKVIHQNNEIRQVLNHNWFVKVKDFIRLVLRKSDTMFIYDMSDVFNGSHSKSTFLRFQRDVKFLESLKHLF